ncbi:MAG: efflux RND transporter permease subunit [Acidobacteriota bacterium]|nr:efflux RND transporter permease subunit [Acidobacteriota bacterium]
MKKTIAKGAIAWMATHKVAANLVMFILLAGGFASGLLIKQEVFPDFTLDVVTVSVTYPGAGPSEVEKGVVLAVEEAIRGLDGIKEINATASEGVAAVAAELLSGFDPNQVLNDVKSAVDRITTFPVEVEKVTTSLASRQRSVLQLVVYGDQSEHALRALAESIRSGLLLSPDITVVNMTGVRAPEISIEVPEENLRAYGLTLGGIADIISRSSLELPAGKIETSGGEILLRTSERRYYGNEFVDLPIVSTPDGSIIRLSDIADVKETFAETNISSSYNGLPAVKLQVFRVGDQKPSEVSDAVKEYIASVEGQMPPDVNMAVLNDMSVALTDRIDLLFRNTFMGLVLVLMLLALFLDIRLAFWVTMGIPISIMGALLFLPLADASINMITLFAFIITIGVVVDDAVVIGEHIFSMREKGMSFVEASIAGAREMAAPVTFSILTNVVAFMPLFWVPGMMGKMFFFIPLIVITIFLISLVEALFILPAHLAHGKHAHGDPGFLERIRRKFGQGLHRFIKGPYRRFLEWCLRWRYVTVAVGTALLMVIAGLVISGRIPFSFFPKVEGDVVTANLALPIGTPVEETRELQKRLVQSAREALSEHGGDDILEGIMAQIGVTGGGGHLGPAEGAASVQGGHIATVALYLVPIDQRDITTQELADIWRDRFGTPPGMESLTFRFTEGPSSGSPIHVALSHEDTPTLEAAAVELAGMIAQFQGVKDINDGFSDGKVQWDFKIKPAGRAAGFTASDIAGQVRNAFFGAEALRNQRNRDEVKVYVRYPKEQRKSRQDVKELVLRTPRGGEMPITEAVDIVESRAYTSIRRTDARRVINVTADIKAGEANANKIVRDLESDQLQTLLAKYPGLSYTLRGEQKEQAESMNSLGIGFALAMLCVFALLAIPFNSYFQPLIIMTSVPFGVVGAVLGHVLMGYELSLMSMMGIVALSGVVVNDSLILIVAANRRQEEGQELFSAVVDAAKSRFRPIIITSLSTFLGLAPMIMETSIQARFLIPMAISLGFGILFATVIALLFVPAFYLILEDLGAALKSIFKSEEESEPAAEYASVF